MPPPFTSTPSPYMQSFSQWGNLGTGTYGMAPPGTNDVPQMFAPSLQPPVSDVLNYTVPSAAMSTPAVPGRGSNFLQDWGIVDQFDPTTGMKIGQGWGGMALGAAGAFANAFMGMQQYKLGKQALAQNKAQFEKNYEAQRSTTNTQLEDRQRARVAANPGAYQSVGDYMAKNAVK